MISYDLDSKQGTYGLGLLVENGLGLTSVTALLSCWSVLVLMIDSRPRYPRAKPLIGSLLASHKHSSAYAFPDDTRCPLHSLSPIVDLTIADPSPRYHFAPHTYPRCRSDRDLRSYRLFPCAAKESFPFLYWVTLWGVCFLQTFPLQ